MMMKKIGKMMVLVAIAVVALAPLASATYVLDFDFGEPGLGELKIRTDESGGEWKDPIWLLGTEGSTYDAHEEDVNPLFCEENPIWLSMRFEDFYPELVPYEVSGESFTWGALGVIGGDFVETSPGVYEFQEYSSTPFTGPEYQNQDVIWGLDATYPIVGEASYLLLRGAATGLEFESMITVPEPATMALLGLGGLLLRRRRRA